MIDRRRVRGSLAATCEPDVHGGWLFAAWERPARGHRIVRQDDAGATWGRVDSLPHADRHALPTGPVELFAALNTWEQEQRDRAYQVIRQLYPEARDAMRTRGTMRELSDPATVLQRKRKRGEAKEDRVAAPAFAGLGGADETEQ